MTVIQTDLSIVHIELIKIFFQANELPNVIVRESDKQMGLFYHKVIEIEYNDDDTSSAIIYMSMRHSGFKNMLDDYLLKCGVSPWELQPATIREQQLAEDTQKRIEKDKQKDKEFDEYFNKRKQGIQSRQGTK